MSRWLKCFSEGATFNGDKNSGRDYNKKYRSKSDVHSSDGDTHNATIEPTDSSVYQVSHHTLEGWNLFISFEE